MKKVFAPSQLSAWLVSMLPDRLSNFGKKAPWYRRGLMANVPLIASALMAPFAIFVAWKGVSMLWPTRQTEENA